MNANKAGNSNSFKVSFLGIRSYLTKPDVDEDDADVFNGSNLGLDEQKESMKYLKDFYLLAI
jgi:hypothetical protein